jgi:acetyl esterase/lipase
VGADDDINDKTTRQQTVIQQIVPKIRSWTLWLSINMEVLSKIEGTELPEISTPTYLHFIPQLLRNQQITNAKPQTYQYGPFRSQQLDVYTPLPGIKPAGAHTKPPIFIFYYGGGYMSGRRQMSLSPEAGNVYLPDLLSLLQSKDNPTLSSDPKAIDRLYHQNIGTFIANHGFVTVIPDYRLVNMDPDPNYDFQVDRDALWPSGAEDIMLSVKWAAENFSDVADTETIFAMGHSAGANHLATSILLPQFIPSHPNLMKSLKKVVTLSATFDYIHSREQRKFTWSRYFGGFEMIEERCPTGLARELNNNAALVLPELLCLHARKDHFGAIDPQKRFWDAWVERGGRGVIREVAGKEHNHMSTIYGVGSGDEEVERWLEDVLEWCIGDVA